jgi:hypothetical protein
MTIRTKIKTFTNPNHKVMELDFNMWASDHATPIEVVNTTLTYSASLQKFILAVVYEQVSEEDEKVEIPPHLSSVTPPPLTKKA